LGNGILLNEVFYFKLSFDMLRRLLSYYSRKVWHSVPHDHITWPS